MKYQRGRTSFFSLLVIGTIVIWLLGAFDNEKGEASFDGAVANLEEGIIKIEESFSRIQNERERLNTAGAERLSKPSEATQRAAEVQSDNIPPVEKRKPVEVKVVIVDLRKLEPRYIPNRFRDKSKFIQLPMAREYYPLRHSDGTLWGCKEDESNQTVCYPVGD